MQEQNKRPRNDELVRKPLDEPCTITLPKVSQIPYLHSGEVLHSPQENLMFDFVSITLPEEP